MWIFENTAQALMAIGLGLAAIDMLAFGFASLFMTLIGLAMVITGALIFFGVINDSTSGILLSIAVTSVILGGLLWKPLKRLQESKSKSKVHSDLTGMHLTLDQDVTPEHPGSYHYSGIDWKLVSTESLTAGTDVEVVDLQVGVMKIKAKN